MIAKKPIEPVLKTQSENAASYARAAKYFYKTNRAYFGELFRLLCCIADYLRTKMGIFNSLKKILSQNQNESLQPESVGLSTSLSLDAT